MKNWSSMRGMQDYFEKEVQIVKDLLQDSEFAVPADWPHMGWVAAQKTFMQQAGVLFADAGRSRNPYQRTAQEQAAIAAYARSMLRMWLRVGATVSKDKWIIHLKELQRKAQLIARAAKWAVQRQYPRDPVFAGPIVVVGVVTSALTTADVRFRSMVQFVSSTDKGSKKLSPFSWGSTLQVFVNWARTVRMVSTPPLQEPDGKAGADTASVSSKSSRLSNRSKSSSGTKASAKSA